MIGAIIGLGLQAVAGGLNAKAQATQQKMQMQAQAEMLEIKAQQQEKQADLADEEMYQQYQMGERQALSQGLQDAQKIAQVRVANASSGIKMGMGGSKQEIENNQRLAADLNNIAIQQSTSSAAGKARINAVNYRASAIMTRANASATSTIASGIDPSQSMLVGMLTGGLTAAASSPQIMDTMGDWLAGNTGGSAKTMYGANGMYNINDWGSFNNMGSLG